MGYKVYECVCCYNSWRGNAVQGFWAYILYLYVVDHLLLTDSGPYVIIFMCELL
jgi:hypothetical protein